MKKKILIVVENAAVPFDTRVWKEALSLHDSGYDVTVLCPKAKGAERGYEMIGGVRVYRHPMPQDGNSALGYLWEYSCALFWEFWFVWWIYLRHGFHTIQGCNPPDNIFLIALPFKLFGVKYIFDHHDAIPELYLSKYDNRGLLYKTQVVLEKLTYLFSDVVMATNASYSNLAVTTRAHRIRRCFYCSERTRPGNLQSRSRKPGVEVWEDISSGICRNHERSGWPGYSHRGGAPPQENGET